MDNSTERDHNIMEGPLLIELHDIVNDEINDIPVLSSVVRNTYFQYLRKILKTNAALTRTQVGENDIIRFAQKVELNALKLCMSSSLYRWVMLNQIETFQNLTDSNIPFFENGISNHVSNNTLDSFNELFVSSSELITNNPAETQNCPGTVVPNAQNYEIVPDTVVNDNVSFFENEMPDIKPNLTMNLFSEPCASYSELVTNNPAETENGSSTIVPDAQNDEIVPNKVESDEESFFENEIPDSKPNYTLNLSNEPYASYSELLTSNPSEEQNGLGTTVPDVQDDNKVPDTVENAMADSEQNSGQFTKPAEAQNDTGPDATVPNAQNIEIVPGKEGNSVCLVSPMETYTALLFEENVEEINQNGVYSKVCQEMEQIFAPENDSTMHISSQVELSNSSSSVAPKNRAIYILPQVNLPKSSSNVVSAGQYFTHKDEKFWSLEYDIKEAQYQQTISVIYELNERKYEKVTRNIRETFQNISSPEIESPSPLPLKKITYKCKERITWHVKGCLSLYYKEKRFRSLDEFRMLAKSIVTSFLQIDPYMEYKYIFKAISKVFRENRTMKVKNITDIQNVVSKVSDYVSEKIKKTTKT